MSPSTKLILCASFFVAAGLAQTSDSRAAQRLSRWKEVAMPLEPGLSARERQMVEKLVDACRQINDVYWRQSDFDGLQLYKTTNNATIKTLLGIMGSRWDLLDENRPFIGGVPMPPGHDYYPHDLTRAKIEDYVKSHPQDKAAIYNPYTVIKRQGDRLIGVPYHEAYKPFIDTMARDLRDAAALSDDPAFANFLRLRADSLLSDDYYKSDLAWLDLKDPKFDVIFAPYETYVDDLLGVKASYGASLLIRDEAESRRLAVYQKYVPDIQDSLPVDAASRPSKHGHLTPMEVMDAPYRAGDLRYGYQAVADNLPNDPRVHEQKGSKKIFFKNFMDARVANVILPVAKKLMIPAQAAKVTGEGYLYGTLMHEISHELGPNFAHVNGKQLSINEAIGPAYSGLEVNQNAHVDAVLQIGAVSETVEVTADAAMVETGQPALGLTVNNQDIDNLPLVNRDVYSLLNLTAGVDTTSAASDNFGAPMQVTLVNGSPNSSIGSVNYTLDGGSNTNGLRNTGNVAPNPDAVQEFRIITNSYPADQGRFGGGSVTMVTKSGTNSIHGTLFEFLRNDKLNANQWVPGQSLLAKSPLHRNQFGGTAGGPIIKNKTFIFGSYSGLRQRLSYFANTATPLTTKERTGDLSSTGGTAPVDPSTGSPFPGKIIPTTRIDPVTKKILDTYLNFTPNLPNNAYEVSLAHPTDTNELIFKIDHNLNDKHRLTFATFYSQGEDLTGLLGNLPWVQRDFIWHQYNYNFSDTWIVSPTKINEFRASYVRNFGGRVNLPAVSLSDLGSKYVIQGAPSLPQISVSGRFNLTSGIPGPVAGSNQYQLRDIFSINTARHSLRIGAEGVLEKMIHATLLNNYGVFSFTTTNPRGTKNATADFLLGLPATMNQDAPTYKDDNDWYYALYVQDDFKVTSRLTVNLGLRWDIQTPITDPFNRFLTYVPGVQSKIVTSAPVGLLFPGDPGVARGIISTQFKNISPRIGIAWDPFGDHKTALRAAGGIFYGSMSGNEWNISSDNQPFAIRQSFSSGAANSPGGAAADVYSLSDPYKFEPGGVGPFPYNYSPKAPKFVAPSAIQGIGLDYVSPYTYQMNAAIQRQVTRDTSFTVAYVSSLTHRIPVSPDLNYPLLTSTATTGNVNARRPYQVNVLSTISVTKSILNAAYHGLQLTGDKRMGHNVSIKGYYTYGKSLDFINSQSSQEQVATDWNNIELDRGRTNNDRRHNAVISGIWEIKYFNHQPKIVRLTAGGWSLSAIGSFRSGTPLTITAGTDRNFDGTNNDRADLIGNPILDPNRPRSQVVSEWFNIAAFSSATLRSNSFDGTAGRNIIDGPGTKNVDIGIFRAFRITESKSLQFRAEASNALNLVNLSSPGTSLGSTSTLGKITTAGPMRQVQLGLKLLF